MSSFFLIERHRITGSSITVDDVRESARAAQDPTVTVGVESSPPLTNSPAEEPQVLSFAELKELIEQGKTDQIPNNRVIPNDLSVHTPYALLVAVTEGHDPTERGSKHVYSSAQEETLGSMNYGE